MRLILDAGKPCPVCDAPSLIDGRPPVGIQVAKRYRHDPALHVGWHFREGQPDFQRWWSVGAVVGLTMVIPESFKAGVPQLDEVMGASFGDEDNRLFLWVDAFVRDEWEAIAAGGHPAFYREIDRKPLSGTLDLWWVTPDFHRLARDIARGFLPRPGVPTTLWNGQDPENAPWPSYKRTMMAILKEGQSDSGTTATAASAPPGAAK